jgi:hypothetical protein
VLGFEPKHKMGVKEVERIVRGFRESAALFIVSAVGPIRKGDC